MIDIEILDKESIISKSPYPHKTNKVTQLLVLKGEVSFIIDFNTYNLQAPAMVLFFPGQVIEAAENFKEHSKRTPHACFPEAVKNPISDLMKFVLKIWSFGVVY